MSLPYSTDEDKAEYESALVHQSKALSNLRKAMMQGLPKLRLAVVAAALLYVYEGLQGHYETAKQQVTSGENLMRLWKASREKSGTDVFEIDDELLDVFPRLSVTLAGYATTNPQCGAFFADENAPIEADSYPKRWTAFNASKMDSLHMTHRILGFMRRIDSMKRNAPLGFVMPVWAYTEAERLETILREWSAAFEPITQELGYDHTFLIFYVGLLPCRIFMTAGLSLEECINDKFLHEWKQIVKGTRISLEGEPETQSGYTKMSSTMELWAPLFWAGTKCRDRAVREEALDIFREYPRKQGL